MQTVMEERGRITLPRELLGEMGWKPGARLRIVVRAGEIALQPIASANLRPVARMTRAGVALWCVVLVASVQCVAAPRRSQGFAGDTPVNQFGALARLDCRAIARSPLRSREAVPLSEDCDLVIPSPDNQHIISIRAGRLTLTGRRHPSLAIEQPVVFRWSPTSDTFFLNDGEGSGQVSRFRYFTLAKRGWRESRRLDRAAEQLFLRIFDCTGGTSSYANVTGLSWRGRMIRAVVQEGVHSEGCLQPRSDRNVMLEVVGDPTNGRIVSYQQINRVD